jgi:aromatic ring-opening dioxygenase LigB subunit
MRSRLIILLITYLGMSAAGRDVCVWKLLTVHGAIEGSNSRGELLSYQVPTYFGIVCAACEYPAG